MGPFQQHKEQPGCRMDVPSAKPTAGEDESVKPDPTLAYVHLFSETIHVYRLTSPVQTGTHLRGPPSSYGGMMTTLTVTDVLRRSIICSWVSVTAATLQISTRRLPCLSPACQAKPYSSTCGGGTGRQVRHRRPSSVFQQGSGGADGTLPQPRCRRGGRGSPAVPVRFSSESCPPSHIRRSETVRGKKEERI